MVCRKYAVPATDTWSKTSVFFLIFTIAGIGYLAYGIYLSMKMGQYNSFSELSQKECTMNIILKVKELINKMFGSGRQESQEIQP